MRFFFRKLKSSSRMAIARGRDNVSIASVVRDGDKPRVVACATRPFPESTTKAWEHLSREFHLARGRNLLLLAPEEYRLIQVDAPEGVPDAELKSAVRWKLKDVLPYPLEQATVDVIEIPPDRSGASRGHYLYAVAAGNEVIRRYMDEFEAADAMIEAIDIPELAQRNIAALLEEPGRGVALLSFSDAGGLLTLTSGGELYHARQIEISVQQLSMADEGQRQHHYERLALELQRSLDNFERQFTYVTISRLVIAPMVRQAALEEYLRANLYIPVAGLDLHEIMNLAAVDELESPAMQAQCFLAIGAALRDEAAV